MWKAITARDGSDVEAWLWLADQLSSVGEFDERQSILGREGCEAASALSAGATDEEHFCAALVFAATGAWTPAIRSYRKCISGSLRSLAYLGIWDAAKKSGDKELADQALSKHLEEEERALRNGRDTILSADIEWQPDTRDMEHFV